MGSIRNHVDVLRSKNAGPYAVTLDIIFTEWDDYHRAKDAEIVTHEKAADLYNIDVDSVMEVVYYDPAKAIKITIKRPVHSGGIGDTDVLGMQQHAPLLELEVPDA